MRKIKIFDTTLRDGEQSPGCSMTMDEKIRMAKMLEELNVDIIEAGFAASSDKDLLSIQEISKVVKKPIITVLARLNKNDIDKAYESLKYADKKRIHVFIATSDIHMKDKLHMTKEDVLLKVDELVKYAKTKCDDIEFSLEDATRTDLYFMRDVIQTAIKSGANIINIPDTVGYITPEEYKYIIKTIKENIDLNNVELSCHCHNDLGLAVANSIAGIESGITQVECTVNGIGERAGNAAMEEIVMALKIRNDYYKVDSNINIAKIKEASNLLVDITGSYIQHNKPIVGENAFKHEAGIHQHGVLNNKETYEIIDSSMLGINESNIVIGIHSGKHAIIKKLDELNINYDVNRIDDYVYKIKDYLSINKTISDSKIIEIVSSFNKVKKRTV